MVTHDRYFLERVCTKMVEISQGKLYTYEANYSQYLEAKALREEQALANEKKRQNLLRKELAWIRAGVQARGTKSKERIERFHALNAQDKPQLEKSIALDLTTSRLGKRLSWSIFPKPMESVSCFEISAIISHVMIASVSWEQMAVEKRHYCTLWQNSWSRIAVRSFMEKL